MIERGHRAKIDPISGLSPRQLQILRLLSEGKPDKAIGLELGISEHTVKSHLRAIFRTLGVNCRVTAAVLAVRKGWI